MKIERFDCGTAFDCGAMYDSDDGEYMLYDDHITAIATLEAKCAALAAENAEMRSSIDVTIGWQESTDPENGESVRMLVDIKTPATDSFLAEVRAQGVEMLLASLPVHYTARADIEAFAAQLRQGAAL